MSKLNIYYYFEVLDCFGEEPLVFRVLDSRYTSACIKVVNDAFSFDQITFIGCHLVNDSIFYPSPMNDVLSSEIPAFDRSID